MRRRGGATLVWAMVTTAIVVAVAVAAQTSRRDGPPLDPRSTAPDGARALVLLGERFGQRVERRAGRPGPTDRVALLLDDQLSRDDREATSAWVDAGGILIIADPGSPLAPAVARPTGATTALRRGACPAGYRGAEAVIGVDVRYEVPTIVGSADGGAWCFGDAESAALVELPQGLGWVVGVGGPAPFTNARLAEEDNAVLVADLLAGASQTGAADGTGNTSTSPVVATVGVLGPSPVGEGEAGLWELLPAGVRQGLAQGVIGLLVFVWAAGRRLGEPVSEPKLQPLPASALVEALGRLYQRAGRQPDPTDNPADNLAHNQLGNQLGNQIETPEDA